MCYFACNTSEFVEQTNNLIMLKRMVRGGTLFACVYVCE